MVNKCYGVECFSCRNKIVVGTYQVEKPHDIIDARLPDSPIVVIVAARGVCTQDLLIHFPALNDRALGSQKCSSILRALVRRI